MGISKWVNHRGAGARGPSTFPELACGRWQGLLCILTLGFPRFAATLAGTQGAWRVRQVAESRKGLAASLLPQGLLWVQSSHIPARCSWLPCWRQVHIGCISGLSASATLFGKFECRGRCFNILVPCSSFCFCSKFLAASSSSFSVRKFVRDPGEDTLKPPG